MEQSYKTELLADSKKKKEKKRRVENERVKLNRGARGKLGTRGHTIPAADSDERLDVRVVKLLYGAPAEFTVLPAWGGNPELKEEKRETEKKKK